MLDAEEWGLRRISNTPQGRAIEGNTADDILMVDQGWPAAPLMSIILPDNTNYTNIIRIFYQIIVNKSFNFSFVRLGNSVYTIDDRL